MTVEFQDWRHWAVNELQTLEISRRVFFTDKARKSLGYIMPQTVVDNLLAPLERHRQEDLDYLNDQIIRVRAMEDSLVSTDIPAGDNAQVVKAESWSGAVPKGPEA